MPSGKLGDGLIPLENGQSRLPDKSGRNVSGEDILAILAAITKLRPDVVEKSRRLGLRSLRPQGDG